MRRSVSPLWPGCPPGLRPDLRRWLWVRRDFGFFSPSEGGLPLLRLFRPRRRSNSSTRSMRRETCSSRSQAFSSRRRSSRAARRLGIAHVVVESFSAIPVNPLEFPTSYASTPWPHSINQTTWAVTKSCRSFRPWGFQIGEDSERTPREEIARMGAPTTPVGRTISRPDGTLTVTIEIPGVKGAMRAHGSPEIGANPVAKRLRVE